MTDLLHAAVRGYAERLHAAIGDGHHVASPLGAWLVLALAASAARSDEAERLAEVLGMPVDEAARTARALLDDPHPAVAAAAAVWTAATSSGPAAEWLAALPDPVERGPVPDQAGADDWARRHTHGLIEQFPIGMDRSWDCVLAGALATRISWSHPFGTTGPEEFRTGWRSRVATVLRTPGHGHYGMVVRHPRAGNVAVHRAHSDGLDVTSVIAETGVPATEVLAAAHEIAADPRSRTSLFDLPLGDGPLWTITEADGIAGEEVAAVLPAWSANSVHDLTPPEFGFGPVAAVLGRLFGADQWDARQAAAARFHREGFEAAAVTALAVGLSFAQHGKRRSALLRFDHPYAAVASVSDGPASPWTGLPVFSAWITEPEDATVPG